MQSPPRIWIAVSLCVCAALLAVVAGPALAPAPVSPRATVVELVDYLPRVLVRDGSVDYTARVQAALVAARGRTLVLPAFPVLVAPPPGKTHCLLVDGPIAIVGSPDSALVERTGRVQLLRCENAQGVRLESFALVGVGGVGAGLAHGTLQVWRCRDVLVRDVRVLDSDADGMAIADSENVRVEHCVVERASKAAIYLSRCNASVVAGNIVRDVVGHVAPNGEKVGTGILLLSNRDVVCTGNLLVSGVGTGILCGANEGLGKPDGALIASNLVRGFANPTNALVACGIALANVDADHATRVVVEGNQILDCGPHGILAENHDAAIVRGNTLHGSALSAIVVGHARDVAVLDNTLVDSNRALFSGQAGVYLHATTSGVLVRGNVVLSTDGSQLAGVIDNAPPDANQVVP